METPVDCPSCGRAVDPDPPRWRRPLGIAGAAVLALVGVAVGAAVGFVLPGRVGVYFLTLPLGLYYGLRFGRRAAARLGDWTCPSCDHAFAGDASRRAPSESPGDSS